MLPTQAQPVFIVSKDTILIKMVNVIKFNHHIVLKPLVLILIKLIYLLNTDLHYIMILWVLGVTHVKVDMLLFY